MDFGLSHEQIAFSETLSRFVANNYGHEQRARYLKFPDGFDPSCWASLAELGLVALFLREEHGGLGGSAIDLMVAARTLGPGLVLDPWWAAVITSRLIEELGNEAQRQAWLSRIAFAETIVGFAHIERNEWQHVHHCGTTARPAADGGYVLDGEKLLTLGAGASHFLVTARLNGAANDPDGLSVFLVPADAPGLALQRNRLGDGIVSDAVVLQSCRVCATARIGAAGGAGTALARVLAEACLMLASETVGVLDAAMGATIDHLRTRKQFGVPLGSFQTVQHRMADCAANLELLRAMVTKAAILLASENTDTATQLAAAYGAKALAAQYGIGIIEECVQFHGAMGITEELWAGRAMKRLFLLAGLFGDGRVQTARYNALCQAGGCA